MSGSHGILRRDKTTDKLLSPTNTFCYLRRHCYAGGGWHRIGGMQFSPNGENVMCAYSLCSTADAFSAEEAVEITTDKLRRGAGWNAQISELLYANNTRGSLELALLRDCAKSRFIRERLDGMGRKTSNNIRGALNHLIRNNPEWAKTYGFDVFANS